MVGSQIRTDSGGIKVKVFLYNPLVNFLKLNNDSPEAQDATHFMNHSALIFLYKPLL